MQYKNEKLGLNNVLKVRHISQCIRELKLCQYIGKMADILIFRCFTFAYK